MASTNAVYTKVPAQILFPFLARSISGLWEYKTEIAVQQNKKQSIHTGTTLARLTETDEADWQPFLLI